jgi:hypothetical protein
MINNLGHAQTHELITPTGKLVNYRSKKFYNADHRIPACRRTSSKNDFSGKKEKKFKKSFFMIE